MPITKKDVNVILEEGLDALQQSMHDAITAAGGTHDVHVAIMAWVDHTLVPWLEGRRDALLQDLVRRVMGVEANVTRLETAVHGQ